MDKFIDREEELSMLEQEYHTKGASLVILYGRRRVGKTSLISEFIKDENGNPLSLVHYCEMFNVPEAGVAHDPSVDAVNLMNLYDAFLNNKEIALNQYKLVLQRTNSHFPPPVAKTITALAAGKDISAQEFENLLKEYLD